MLCSVNIRLLISHGLTRCCIFALSMSAYFSTIVMPIRQMSSKQMVSKVCSSVVCWGSCEPIEIQSRKENDNVSEISLCRERVLVLCRGKQVHPLAYAVYQECILEMAYNRFGFLNISCFVQTTINS